MDFEKKKNFYYLLGLFAGDGWFQRRGISIGTANKKRSMKIANLMQTVLKKRVITKRRKYKDGHVMYIVSIYSVELEKNSNNY